MRWLRRWRQHRSDELFVLLLPLPPPPQQADEGARFSARACREVKERAESRVVCIYINSVGKEKLSTVTVAVIKWGHNQLYWFYWFCWCPIVPSFNCHPAWTSTGNMAKFTFRQLWSAAAEVCPSSQKLYFCLLSYRPPHALFFFIRDRI